MPKVAFSDCYVTIWRGEDCLTFLDGLSSNQTINLNNNHVIQSSILNKNAKIIDFVTILNLGGFLAIVGHENNFQAMLDFVTPKILQSDVAITDITELNDVVIIYDEENTIPIGTCETIDEVTYASISNGLTYCIAGKKINFGGENMGEEFNEWRIDNVIPWYEYEINSKSIPYSCGLNKYVHDSKGCYTGQEILTRMRTRNRGIKILKNILNSKLDKEKVTTKGREKSLVLVNQ